MSQEELQGSVQLALLAQLVSLVHLREAVYLADTLDMAVDVVANCGLLAYEYPNPSSENTSYNSGHSP